jgi:hypothetical protein
MTLNLIFVTILVTICMCQTPPVWPNQFEIEFNETTKELATSTTKGKIYFDSINQKELVTR